MPGPTSTTAPPPERLRSLDVFRGLTIASMIVVNTQGEFESAHAALRHAAWNGWTFADTIFPAFLWIMGVALTLSAGAHAARGADRTRLVARAARRSLLLFACGVFLAAFSFPSRHFPYFWFRDYLQLTGVLQKIAVCYFAAFLVFLWTDWKGVLAWMIGLNLAYLGLLFFYPVPGCGAGSLMAGCNFPAYLDHIVIGGYRWHVPGAQDPDGLGAILPAVSTVLCGVLAGQLLRRAATPRQRIVWLAATGLVLVCVAALLSAWVPVNKPIWTPSYALLMSGFASIGFAACYVVVDLLRRGAWFRPLEILGMSAITAYVVSMMAVNVPKVHVFGLSLYDDLCRRVADPANAALLYSVVYLLGVWVIVWLLHRRGWALRF